MPETSLSNDPEDRLEAQKCIWRKEQELVASQVQVYSDPAFSPTTQNLQRQHHDRDDFAEVVEDTSWCTILKSSHLENDDDSGVDSSNPSDIVNADDPLQKSHENNSRKNYYFGGVDVGFPNPPAADGNTTEEPMAVAVYVILDARTMKVVHRDHEWIPYRDLPPYVSTFLAFREIGPLERLVKKQLASQPELTPSAILVDGNGIFHPRHSGIACFLGVRTGIPTIGIGKTLLWIEETTNDDNQGGENDESDSNTDSKIDEEYRWTRDKLDERIDEVLADVHQRFVSDAEDASGLARRLRKHGGLIVPKGITHDQNHESTTNASDAASPREKLLQGVFPFCNGITIPLEAPPNHSDGDDHRFRFLGAALVGHGGRRKGSASGSKRPVIVSVGHKLSLAEAASIAASLSAFRIPEPVREADLYGRELLRQRKML